MKKRMYSKIASVVAACTMSFATVLGGCGSATPSQPTGTDSILNQSITVNSDTSITTSSASSADKITLHTMTRWSGSDGTTSVWNEAIKAFEAANTNITIVDDSISDESAYNNKFKALIATGDIPNIFYSPEVASLAPYAKNGLIMDITPLMEDKSWYNGFSEGVFENWNFETYGVKGYYGVPISGGTENFYYNKDLFAKAGITETPQTMEELSSDIDKLAAIGVTPWELGAKDTWRVGHILNNVLYKICGVQKAKDIGARTAKWTDSDVVAALQCIKDLQGKGAFGENPADVSYAQEEADFLDGKSALMLNGVWVVSDVLKSNISDKIGTFAFPYFKDKPQYKNEGVSYPQGLQLSGKATGAEKDAQIAFIKFLTSKEWAEKFVEATQRTPVRKDVDVKSLNLSSIFDDVVTIQENMKSIGGDTFDFDPLASMPDRTRNSLIGMLLNNGADAATAAAQEIQSEIDSNG